MNIHALTPEQLYRFQERLGILCEDREPTPEQEALALKEALEFKEPAPRRTIPKPR